MKRTKYFQFIILGFLFFECDEPIKKMSFPSEIQIIYDTKEPCVNCKGEVIFYLDGTKHSLYVFTNKTINWQKFSQQFPNLNVKVYLANNLPKGYNSLSEVISFFEKSDFPFPIYWDPENSFFEINRLDQAPTENKTFQIYLVKENEILCSHDFGIPSLREKQLEEHFGMKPIESEE